MAGLDRPGLPVKTGKFCRSGMAIAMLSPFLNHHMQPVEIGLAQSALGDLEKVRALQLIEVGPYASLPCSHVAGKCLLTGIDGIIGPGVFEQHGIGELGANGQLLVGEDEIRDHRESVARRRIGTNDFDVAGDLTEAA